MKIKVSIEREFDTEEWKDEDSLWPKDVDPDFEVEFAINSFAEEIDYLVKYNEVCEAVRVDIYES